MPSTEVREATIPQCEKCGSLIWTDDYTCHCGGQGVNAPLPTMSELRRFGALCRMQANLSATKEQEAGSKIIHSLSGNVSVRVKRAWKDRKEAYSYVADEIDCLLDEEPKDLPTWFPVKEQGL